MEDLDKKLYNLFENNYKITSECEETVGETLRGLKSKKMKPLIYKISKMAAIFILTIGITTVTAYVGEKIYTKYFASVKENSEINYSDIEMIYNENNNCSYKIIDNKKTLEEFKKLYNNIPDVDFNTQYILVIQPYSKIIDEIDIKEIYSDDTTTYVTLSNRELTHNVSINQNILCYTLDNSLKRDFVNINIIPGSVEITKYGFTTMNDINLDYCENISYKENCIVLDNIGNVLSNNENLIYSFIEKSQNNESCAIRIVKDIANNFDNNGYLYRVTDVIYEKGIYYYFDALYGYDGIGYAISKSDGKEIKLEKNDNNYFLLILGGKIETRVATINLK